MLMTFLVATATMLPSQQAIHRLDGSVITPAEIGATVLRLMHSAEVTGVGITFFVSY
jgi:hypothetical protein